MAWLLDSNSWIDYLKNPRSAVRTRLEQRSPGDVRTCAIVKAELLHGARKYGNPERRLALVAEAFAPYASLPFDDSAAEHYARIRHNLESVGRVIGPNDLLIAAICLANDCTLATGNLEEFRRVTALRVEDWTAPPL
jgi:tRNA(fMet)-specific endonuclease VapC